MFQFTQTTTGRNAAVSLLQRTLAAEVNGEVRIGPVFGGNLVTRISISRFEIRDPDSEIFVALDSVTVEYDPLALLRSQLRIRRLHAMGVDVRLIQSPDGTWNFDRVFGDAEGDAELDPAEPTDSTLVAVRDEMEDASIVGEEPGDPFRLILGDASVESGSIEIRTPWTAGLEGVDKRRAVREAESGGSLWAIRKTDDGEYERVYRLDGIRGRFPELRIVDPPRPLELHLDEVSARLSAVRQPLELGRLNARATFGDSIHIEVDRFETDGSVVFGSGWVASDASLEYAFRLSADPLDFRDVSWLPVPLPETGGGPMAIDLASRRGDMVVSVADADARSDDTRIRGGFTLAVERTPRFEDIDVDLAPLRLSWLDELLDRDTEVDGWVRGSLTGRGRIDDLTVEADVTLEDVESGTPPSTLRARGGLGLEEPYPLRALDLEFETFEPRWARILGLDATLTGRVDGSVTLDRPGGEALSFDGAVSHLTSAGDLSRLSGSGTVTLDERSSVDLVADVRPLALTVLRPWLPDIDLAGSVSGPVRARGDLSGLSARAALQTERGRLTLDGTFVLDSDEPRYDTEIEASDLSLDQWLEGAPESRLAVRGRINGEGTDPATLDAAFDLEILPSELDQAEIFDSRVRFRVADGLATIDTLAVFSDVGTLSGRGRFGLAEGQLGTLEFEADVRDLSRWNRWFGEEIPGGDVTEPSDALFESFEAAFRADADEGPIDGLSGRLSARGVAVGRWEDFTVEAFLEGSQPRYRGYRADTLSARVQLLEPPSTDAAVVQLTASGAELEGRRIDSLSVRLERSEPGAVALDLHARRDSTAELSASGDLEAGDRWSTGLDRLRVRLGKLESTLVRPTRITYSDSALVVDELALTGPLGRVEADGRVPAVGEGDLALELFGIRVDQLGYLVSEAPEVGGTLQGSGRVVGTLSDPRMTGRVRVTQPSIRNQFYADLEATAEYSDRRVDGVIDLSGEEARLARLSGSVRTDLSLLDVERRLLDDPFDFRIQGDSVPLALLELRVQGLEEISGIGDADISLRGAPGELRYGGQLELIDGRAWVPDLGVWMTGVGGEIEFSGSEARIRSGRVSSDLGGFVQLGGVVDIASLADPEFDLDLEATDFHAVSRIDMSLAIGGTGTLGGRYTQPLLTGRFRLSEGDLRPDEFLRARQVIDLSDPAVYALLDSASVGERRLLERFRNEFMDNLVVDAEVSLGPNLWLRSPELDVELVARDLDVDVDRARDSLTVVGGVGLPRGTYRFDRLPPYVQSLRITEGSLQFVGNPDFNPNLDITAEYRNRTEEGPVVVEARIGGTLRESTLELSSTPPMSDTDRLCFLAVGTPCYQSADAELGQRLVRQSILGTVSTGISSALVGSTGLSYFNLRSVGGSNGSTGIRGSQSVFDRTAVEFGVYASQDIFLSFSQSLGGGPPRATLEWSFLPNWTLEARADSRFDERLFGLSRGTSLANEQTFGLFLFRDWDF
ncbi:MAG: translocation/assembly module TamB [Gemmatimonadetes bacterium]|nr:translocation/assembly module TamB [Gemmatimonadota bacterium]